MNIQRIVLNEIIVLADDSLKLFIFFKIQLYEFVISYLFTACFVLVFDQ